MADSATPAPEAPRRPSFWRSRRLFWVAGGALAVLAVLLIAARLALEPILERRIEAAASEALGAAVEIGSLKLGLLSGSILARDIRIASPLDAERPPVLAIGEAALRVPLRSLRGPEVVVEEMRLTGVRIASHRDRDRSADISTILHNAREGRRGESEDRAPAERREPGQPRSGDDRAERTERPRTERPARVVTIRRAAIEDFRADFSNQVPSTYRGDAGLSFALLEARDLRIGAGAAGRILLEQLDAWTVGGVEGEPLLEAGRLDLSWGPGQALEGVLSDGTLSWMLGSDRRSTWKRFREITYRANIRNDEDDDEDDEDEDPFGFLEAEREAALADASAEGDEPTAPAERRRRSERREGGGPFEGWLGATIRAEGGRLALGRQLRSAEWPDRDPASWEVVVYDRVAMAIEADSESLRLFRLEANGDGRRLLLEGGGDGSLRIAADAFPAHLLSEWPKEDSDAALARAMAAIDIQGRWEGGVFAGTTALAFDEVDVIVPPRPTSLFARLRTGAIFDSEKGSPWARTLGAVMDPESRRAGPFTSEFRMEMREWSPVGAFFLLQLHMQEVRVDAMRSSGE